MFKKFLKLNHLDKTDTINELRRLNKVGLPAYIEATNEINTSVLEDADQVVLLLKSKYSLLTTMKNIAFIIKLLNFYLPVDEIVNEYEEIHSELLSIYENPNLYTKCSYTMLYNFIEAKVCDYIQNKTNYTKYRNLILLALLLQFPIKLHYLIDIKYMSYEGVQFEDAFPHPVVLMKIQNDLFFVFNKKTIVEQIVVKVEDKNLRRLVLGYLAMYLKGGSSLFSSIHGKPISKSNLSNGIVNYTRSELGFPLSIFDIKNIYCKENNKHSSKTRFLLTF